MILYGSSLLWNRTFVKYSNNTFLKNNSFATAFLCFIFHGKQTMLQIPELTLCITPVVL